MGSEKRIKYIEDYVDEMSEYFPGIEKKFLLYMMKKSLSVISTFMRVGYRVFAVSATKTLIDDGKVKVFHITSIFTPSKFKHILSKARNKRYYKNKT
ncbi:MAG: hypothetical protein KAH32_03800 [Chlamydiia bacterium]|nr:hypothetical protein [Chlamydiia bacterium]